MIELSVCIEDKGDIFVRLMQFMLAQCKAIPKHWFAISVSCVGAIKAWFCYGSSQ